MPGEDRNDFVETTHTNGYITYGGGLGDALTIRTTTKFCDIHGANVEMRFLDYGTNLPDNKWACDDCTKKALAFVFRISRGQILNE